MPRETQTFKLEDRFKKFGDCAIKSETYALQNTHTIDMQDRCYKWEECKQTKNDA